MNKLFALILAAFFFGVLIAPVAEAYHGCNWHGQSCYNCNYGSFGYGNSYSGGYYGGSGYQRGGWYQVNLKYHYPYGNYYGAAYPYSRW